MRANHEWTRMDTNSEKLLLKDQVFQIVGCAIEVLNTLGHGLVEKPYENALVVEFLLRKIPFRQSRRLSGLNYLRITGMRVGVIFNFKHRKLEGGEDRLIKFVSIRVHSWLTA
jgi:PD-(D/E)XK nuclease superfamily